MLKENGAWRRLIVEKPFGTDLAFRQGTQQRTARSCVEEQQIYRIDHYLGKETVQNILVLRFANGMFEPIWNRNHIDHVQITVAEKLGVGHRGSFYDATGALRDMVPNHLFQLLSLVAMEPPAHSTPTRCAPRRRSAGRRSRPRASRKRCTMRCAAQYRGGKVGESSSTIIAGAGRRARQHHRNLCRAEADDRQLALGRRAVLSAHRQGAGVKRTEIAIKFKQAPLALFRDTPVAACRELSHPAIQPTEGITLQFGAKVPGPEMKIDGVEMKFRYKITSRPNPSTGYETLIYDCMTGDASCSSAPTTSRPAGGRCSRSSMPGRTPAARG